MQIKIREDAAKRYVNRQVHNHQNVNSEWEKTLKQIQGMTLEVETKYLFKDQYNTVPIPGVSEKGLRIMEQSVEEVIDDVRPNFQRCHWCGKLSPVNATECEHCGKSEYLEKLA